MQDDFLKLNDDKTEFMLIGSSQQLAKVTVPRITIGGSVISPVTKARNLGVVFDSAMSLNYHVSNIVRSASFHIRNIGHIRKYLDTRVAEQIVHCFITSRLDMGNALLFSLPKQQIDRLQRIQNSAARVITLSKKSCHITPILQELHWLPVSQRIEYKILLFVFKSLMKRAPGYIDDLIEPYTPSRRLRSSFQNRLVEPISNRSWGDRSFSRAAPRLWNKLPTRVKSASTLTEFKSYLKTYLFSLAFM